MKRSLFFTAALATAASAWAQGPGGLYIGGDEVSLSASLQQALTNNPAPGGRFFVLVLPAAQAALNSPEGARLRQQLALVRERGGAVLVCRRDVASGAFSPSLLGGPATEVRGWPVPGGEQLLPGSFYYPGESPASLPEAHDLLKRLRSTCSG